jgi:hypothetical protein
MDGNGPANTTKKMLGPKGSVSIARCTPKLGRRQRAKGREDTNLDLGTVVENDVGALGANLHMVHSSAVTTKVLQTIEAILSQKKHKHSRTTDGSGSE